MKRLFTNKSFLISFFLGLIFFTIGFAILHNEWAAYGWVIFIFLPLITGFVVGSIGDKKEAILGLILSLVFFLINLICIGLEGLLCTIMALPILLPMLILGWAIRRWYLKYYNKKKDGLSIYSIFIPMVILVVGVPIENTLVNHESQTIEVRSEIILPYEVMQVYDAIKSVDTLTGELPWLMEVDLPVPYKCILEEEKVGGLRTCYFEGGRIVEQITALEKGKLLKMDVINYELTGRKWLGFKEAIYEFDSIGVDSCKMTRITTYTSTLYPRAYWEPLERMGIEQEHQYVFNNLKRDLIDM
ncbi:polyketide cyclase [Fulvivirga ligni]|uniref:polyketide cyclase n=1 Tax=Fulvivirga ligni TaxID=2904246 RepID=UPI001F45805F|nr:polyketide cyclase [Fulvivirga ligni]UII20459.1 polyketide cyclase [Fulvivirga ligni]